MKAIQPTITKAAFDKLTTRQKRVAIAKDVLFRIDAKRIIPHSGVFQQFKSSDVKRSPQRKCNMEQCYACAKGAIVLSYLGLFNRFDFNDFGLEPSYGRGTKEIVSIFGAKMWDVMEMIFEQWDAKLDGVYYGLGKLVHSAFYDSSADNDRVDLSIAIALFSNIVKNKGVIKFSSGLVISGDKIIPAKKTVKS